MEAIILAGGLGTRLKEVVSDVPKPMAKVNGHPFLYYQFNYLLKQGITKVILSTGYKHEVIENYFGDFFNGIPIEYSIEETPLGTGGAIRKALDKVHGDYVFILNGDTFFEVSLSDMLKHHISFNADVTLSLKPMKEFERYGSVITNGTRVTGFEEKVFKEKGNINGGVYILGSATLQEFEISENFSFETDFLSQNIGSLNIQAYISDGYFIDIGIPDDYFKAQEELKRFQ